MFPYLAVLYAIKTGLDSASGTGDSTPSHVYLMYENVLIGITPMKNNKANISSTLSQAHTYKKCAINNTVARQHNCTALLLHQ